MYPDDNDESYINGLKDMFDAFKFYMSLDAVERHRCITIYKKDANLADMGAEEFLDTVNKYKATHLSPGDIVIVNNKKLIVTKIDLTFEDGEVQCISSDGEVYEAISLEAVRTTGKKMPEFIELLKRIGDSNND